jgi:hypothetical protein
MLMRVMKAALTFVMTLSNNCAEDIILSAHRFLSHVALGQVSFTSAP